MACYNIVLDTHHFICIGLAPKILIDVKWLIVKSGPLTSANYRHVWVALLDYFEEGDQEVFSKEKRLCRPEVHLLGDHHHHHSLLHLHHVLCHQAFVIQITNQINIFLQVIFLILGIVLVWLRIDWGTTDWAHRVTTNFVVTLFDWAHRVTLVTQ